MKAQKVESESENTADEDESSCSEPEMVEETDNQDSEGVEDQVEVLRTSSVKEAHTDINAIQMIPHNGELNKAKPKPANTEPAICEESSESNLTSIENVANSYFGLKLNESELSVTPQGSEISDSEAKNVDSPIDKSENSDSEDILTTSKFRMPPKQATPAKKAVDGHNCKSSQNCDEDLDIEKLPSALDHAPVLIDKTNADHIVVVISKLDKSSHEYQVVFDSGENAWVTVDHNNLPQIFQQYDQENYPRNHPEQLVAKQLMSTGSNLSSIPSVIESDSDSD